MENDLIIATWLLDNCDKFFDEADTDDWPPALAGLIKHWLAQRDMGGIANSKAVEDFRNGYVKLMRSALD